MATFAIDCTVWILSLQTLPDSPAYSGLQELARSLEEVIRDAHYTDEVGTSSKSHASSVPKAEAPERPISKPVGFHAMDTPPMAGADAKQAHGDSTEPEESYTPQTGSMYPVLRYMYRFWLR